MSAHASGRTPRLPKWFKRLAVYGTIIVSVSAGSAEVARNFKDVVDLFSLDSSKTEEEKERGCQNCTTVAIKGNGNTVVLNGGPGRIELPSTTGNSPGGRTDPKVIPFKNRLQLDEFASIKIPGRERMARRLVEKYIGNVLAVLPDLEPNASGPAEAVPLPRLRPWLYYGIKVEAQGDVGEVVIIIEARSCEQDRPPECIIYSDAERWKYPVFIDPK
jgi:hypothetical protein